MTANNWQKFRLLMWKNWLIQWRHKLQTIVEILMPVLCTAVLVVLRALVEVRDFPGDRLYPPVAIDSLGPLRGNISSLQPIDWRLAYSPQNAVLDQLVDRVAFALQLNGYVGFDTGQELEDELLETPFLCGIEFDATLSYVKLPQQLNYALRFPGELRTARTNPLTFNWQTDKFEPIARLRGPRARDHADGGLPPGYVREGFVPIQHALADIFLRLHSSEAFSMPETVRVQRYPFPPFRLDSLLDILEELVALIVLLSFIYPAINTVRVIATEKERQLKEAMQIMGMPGWLHWVGWFVRSMLYMMVSISLMVMMLKVRWTAQPVAVMSYTDWTVLWVYLAVFSVSTVTFCFMMSVFFAKANLAAAVTGIVWFTLYLVYVFLQPDGMQLWQMLTLSAFFANTGMALGFLIMLRYEAVGEGSQWSNLFRPQSVDNDLSVGLAMCMMLVAALVYLLIAMYVEQIRPGDYGVPRPWYFPVTRNFWLGPEKWRPSGDDRKGGYDERSIEGDNNNDDGHHDPGNFEATPITSKTRHAGIRIRELRKTFNKTTTAVHRLTLDMYEDQITVLLGHNGAGKTTTMSMLTGMLPPSGGTAFVNGYDIRTDIRAVRGSVGLCPQHNILFDDLTVAEHIAFYARLKGVTGGREVEAEIERYVELLQLRPKRDVAARALSGGMKRKLSVSVAFCGGSRVVFCDEPSSGMDPAARRALWEVFRKEKYGRTVLLSTHFMDEADVLGDRIAIMNAGRLRCCGSSYFLKKRFGAGYHLVCAKEVGAGGEEMERLVGLLRRYDPDVRVEVDGPTEVSLVLTEAKVAVFEEMFGELERRGGEVGVRSFGVSLTTLEEVFLKVGTDVAATAADGESVGKSGAEAENGLEALKRLSMGSVETVSTLVESGSDISLTHMDSSPLLTGFPLYSSQTRALFKKRLIQTCRSWVLFLAQMLIPALFALFTILTDRSNRQPFDLPRLHLDLRMFRESTAVLQTDTTIAADDASLRARFAQAYSALVTVAHPSGTIITHGLDFQQFMLDLSHRALLLVNRAYFVGAAMIADDTLTVWFNNQPYHAVPVALNLAHTALLQTHLGSTNYSISVTSAPLPYDEAARIQQVTIAGQLGYFLAMNVSYAMAFVMAFYVLPFVREQANRAKLLQFVSGAKVLIYWGTALVFDYATFVLASIALLVVFAAFQETGWSTPLELGQIALVLATFAMAALPVTYLAARLFTVPTAGYTLLTIVYIVTGLLFATMVTALQRFGFVDSAAIMEWVFLLMPHFALNTCLRHMQNLTQTQQVCEIQCKRLPGCTPEMMCTVWPRCCEHSLFDFAEPGIGTPLVYMAAVGLVAIVINLLIELRYFNMILDFGRSRCTAKVPVPLPDAAAVADTDVLAERVRVQTLSAFQRRTHSLVVEDVSKMYGRFCSVNRLSLAVDGGECFGLLGVNGAGKTTTFRMLTGDLPISAGDAWVRGHSLRTQMTHVHRNIGYCPQFEALVDEMTCRETLHLFARLRGIRPPAIAALVARLASELHFTRHLDKQVRHCSGGNRRKLSTAVALIGQPAVVYMDEPTTGMDPGAKRHLWDMVNRMRAGGTAVVLTSHSMDECEALCTRLAIMVNGQFKCLGSVQHLKSKFSTGYTLVVQLRRGGEEATTVAAAEPHGWLEVREFVRQSFALSVLQSDIHGLLTYYIPNDGQLRWSTMFGRMHRAKQRLAALEDYTISQTTLEQVFLAFAKKQFAENDT